MWSTESPSINPSERSNNPWLRRIHDPESNWDNIWYTNDARSSQRRNWFLSFDSSRAQGIFSRWHTTEKVIESRHSGQGSFSLPQGNHTSSLGSSNQTSPTFMVRFTKTPWKSHEIPVWNSNSSKKVTIVEIDPAIAHAQITEMNILHLCGDIARVSLMHSLLKQAKDPEAEGYFTKTELLSLVFEWYIQCMQSWR